MWDRLRDHGPPGRGGRLRLNVSPSSLLDKCWLYSIPLRVVPDPPRPRRPRLSQGPQVGPSRSRYVHRQVTTVGRRLGTGLQRQWFYVPSLWSENFSNV